MAGERVELPLGEVCDVKQGRYLGPGDMSEVKTEQAPIPVIGANGILGYTNQVSYREPVTLVTCRGSNCGMLQRTKGPTWISNNAMACPPKKPHDSRYIHYVLQTTDFGEVITGSAQPQITTGHLNTKVVTITRDTAEQKAIAAVLGALDDKIELNRRMNATLEAMARALFQSWFVDFDPVRAKLDGRPPANLDPATAALFPAAFQDSEAGHIPKSWTVGRIADVAEFSRASVNPGNFPDETFDHYSLPAFDQGRIPKEELGATIKSNKFVVTHNSVLLSKLNPHIPRIWLPDLHRTRRSVCSTEFIVAATHPGYSREFLFSLFTSAAFASTYGTLVTGTTGSHQRIRPESVLEIKTVFPSPKLVEAFTTIAKPMFDQINRNINQSRTLAALRDTLLPKLLSGEIAPGIPESTQPL